MLFFTTGLWAAAKKSKKPEPKAPTTLRESAIPERDISSQFQYAEDRLKKGALAESLRLFQGIYDYTKISLAAMDCVKNGYIKLGNDAALEQNAREDIFIRLQRIGSLKPEYVRYRNESAYYIGLICYKQGDNEQAGKYLLEVCQTAPVSLDPKSLWMKAKILLLETLYLQGEF